MGTFVSSSISWILLNRKQLQKISIEILLRFVYPSWNLIVLSLIIKSIIIGGKETGRNSNSIRFLMSRVANLD